MREEAFGKASFRILLRPVFCKDFSALVHSAQFSLFFCVFVIALSLECRYNGLTSQRKGER